MLRVAIFSLSGDTNISLTNDIQTEMLSVDSEAIRLRHIITERYAGKSDSYVQHACLFFASLRQF